MYDSDKPESSTQFRIILFVLHHAAVPNVKYLLVAALFQSHVNLGAQTTAPLPKIEIKSITIRNKDTKKTNFILNVASIASQSKHVFAAATRNIQKTFCFAGDIRSLIIINIMLFPKLKANTNIKHLRN